MWFSSGKTVTFCQAPLLLPTEGGLSVGEVGSTLLYKQRTRPGRQVSAQDRFLCTE